MPDMLFILLLALVVLGPGKLPEFARQLGKYKAKLKHLQRELTDPIALSEIRNAAKPSQPETTAARE